MALTPEQQQKLEQWMKARNVHPVCPMCQQSKWQTIGLVYLPGASPSAAVEIRCGNCGYVLLFSAQMMGLA